MSLLSLFAVALSFARINAGEDSNNLFIFPSRAGPNGNFAADLSFPLGSTLEIQWNTTLDSYDIVLYQQPPGMSPAQQLMTIYSAEGGGGGQNSFDWQIKIGGSNLSFSPVYFLWVSPGAPRAFTSHYFNITNRAQSSSSSSSSSSRPSSSSSSSSSPSSSSPSNSSSSTAFPLSTSSTNRVIASSTSHTPSQKSLDTIPTSPASTSSSTETVKVGLGVGLGIGIPLVLIAGIWIGLKSAKQRQSSSRGTSSDVPLAQFPNNKYPPNSYPPPSDSRYHGDRFHEAPGMNHERHELPEEREPFELE